MRAILTVFPVIFVAIIFATAAQPKTTPPPNFAIHGNVENGKKLYNTNCASCHGKTGQGNGIVGQALKPPPASFVDVKRFASVSDWELFVAVRDGGAAVQLSPTMPGWSSTMKEQEIQDVLTYIKTGFIEPARKSAK